jgi:hypothetical protein
VYRDTGEPDEPPTTTPPAESDESEAAYWYGIVEQERPRPAQEETRGPFEPLVSSSSSRSDSLRSDTPPPEAPAAGMTPEDVPEEAVDPHAEKNEKLERIKDLYLTAEAIGEKNVDKHFDLLLAQQRELISQYFKQPGNRSGTSTAPDDKIAGEVPAAEGETTQAGAASTSTEW